MPECKYCGVSYSENIINIHEPRCNAKVDNTEPEEPAAEELVKEYHVGGGYYDIPGIEHNIHGKQAAIEALKADSTRD